MIENKEMAFIDWKMCEKYTVDESLKIWLVDLDITSNVTSKKKVSPSGGI